MTHNHQVKKIKNNDEKLDDNSVETVTFSNTSGMPISIGRPSVILYPGDTAISCEDNPHFQKLVSSKKITVISSYVPSKPKKQTKAKEEAVVELEKEEPLVEETFETVADLEANVSVQLAQPDSDALSDKDAFLPINDDNI